MEEGQIIFIFVIGGLLLLLLIGMIWDKIRLPKELKLLISAAQVLGLAYEPENLEIITKFGHLGFLESLSTKAVRVLSGQIGKTYIYLFFLSTKQKRDTKYIIDVRRVIILHSPRVNLPYFCLRPERALQKTVSRLLRVDWWLGIRSPTGGSEQSAIGDIKFPEDSEFSKLFELVGEKDMTRRLFDADVRHYLKNHPHKREMTMQGWRDALLWTSENYVLSHKNIDSYVQQATYLFELFASRAEDFGKYKDLL
jgi:hypothetical protein